MKQKNPSRQKPGAPKPEVSDSAIERKLQIAVQRIRNNPSIVAGVIIIGYCVGRVIFSV